MKKKIGFLAIVATVLVTSCTYQKNNRIEQKDVNAGSEYVYGLGPDSMARQRKLQYEPKTENAVRAAAIQETLYGKNGNDGSNSVSVN